MQTTITGVSDLFVPEESIYQMDVHLHMKSEIKAGSLTFVDLLPPSGYEIKPKFLVLKKF